MGERANLIGKTFNYLTVIDFAEDYISPQGYHYSQWLCRCNLCGNTVTQRSDALRASKAKSCGCIKRRPCTYEMQDDYVIFYTNQGEAFYVDIDDFDKVKNIAWCKNNNGYLTGTVQGKMVLLHRYIMNCPDDIVVDHIGGLETRHDNRKANLRIATNAQNHMNIGLTTTNTSGHTGVYWSKARQKWVAQIGVGVYENTGKKHCMYLGSYDNKEDAITARKQAEEKYYGNFSYSNSQNLIKEGI